VKFHRFEDYGHAVSFGAPSPRLFACSLGAVQTEFAVEGRSVGCEPVSLAYYGPAIRRVPDSSSRTPVEVVDAPEDLAVTVFERRPEIGMPMRQAASPR
jgi:hypothetical protein